MTKEEKRKIAIQWIEAHARDYDWDDLSEFIRQQTWKADLSDQDLLEIGDMIDYAKVTVELY